MKEEENRVRVAKHLQRSHKNRAKSQSRGSHKETKVSLNEAGKERGILMAEGEEREGGGGLETYRRSSKMVGQVDAGEAAGIGGWRETLEGSKEETGEGGRGNQTGETEGAGINGRGGDGAMTGAMTTMAMTGSGRQGKDRVGEMVGMEEGVGVAGGRIGMHHMAFLLLLLGNGEGETGKMTGTWDMAGGDQDCSEGENFSII